MGKADRRQDKARALAKADERRRVALRVFQGCDEAGARVRGELASKGVTPSCIEGCSYCCHYEVPVSRAEVEALVAWLLETRSPAELDAIRARLRTWLAWYRTAYPVHVASGMERADVFFRHGPACALLVDQRCTAYAVRPVTCRNMLVSSPPSECDPARGSGDPALIEAFGRAAYPHVVELQQLVARQGGDYLATIHLLPEWLAHLLDVEREPWVGAPPLQLG